MTPRALAPPGAALAAVYGAAGVAGGVIGVHLAASEPKFLVTGLAGLIGAAVLLAAGGLGLGRLLLIIALAFSLALNVSITFLLHVFTDGQYVQNVGGAAGVTVTLTLLAALALLGQSILRRGVLRPPLGMAAPWLVFAAVGVATTPFAPDPALVWFELVRIAGLLVILTAVASLRPRELAALLICLAVSASAQGALGVLQVVTGHDFGLGFFGEEAPAVELIGLREQSRATGTIGHPNTLAYFFELQLPLFLGLAIAAHRATERVVFGAALLGGAAGLAVTYSRAGWLTMGVLLPIMLLWVARRDLMTRRGVAAAILGAVMLAGAATALAPKAMERLFGDDGGSLSQRAPLNAGALDLIAQSPLLGHGLNNFGPAFALYDTTGSARIFGALNHVVHNMYLLVAAETGLIGLGVFLWAFAAAILRAMRLARGGRPRWVGVAGLGVAAGLVAQLVHGVVDPGFRLNLSVSQLIFVVFGVIVALERHFPPQPPGEWTPHAR